MLGFSIRMLSDFIAENREKLIALTRAKIAKRLAPRPTDVELTSGVPLFLDQLADTLQCTPDPFSGSMDHSVALHGAALLGRGYTVAQVVHDYGEICAIALGSHWSCTRGIIARVPGTHRDASERCSR